MYIFVKLETIGAVWIDDCFSANIIIIHTYIPVVIDSYTAQVLNGQEVMFIVWFRDN